MFLCIKNIYFHQNPCKFHEVIKGHPLKYIYKEGKYVRGNDCEGKEKEKRILEGRKVKRISF